MWQAQLFNALVKTAPCKLGVETANEHDLGCLAWAFAAADAPAGNLFAELFQQRLVAAPREGTPTCYCTLHNVNAPV